MSKNSKKTCDKKGSGCKDPKATKPTGSTCCGGSGKCGKAKKS